MKYRLIIFDFDGTLANSMPWVLTIMNELADKYHIRRVRDDELELLRGFDAKRVISHMDMPKWKIPIIGNDFRAMMTRDIHLIPLFDGIDQLLPQLVQMGATLAVVSSNSVHNVREVLGPVNAALFQYYECGASIFGKSAKFKKILGKSGIPHNQALSIGDEIRDIEAAKSVNIACGAVAWGYTKVEALISHSPTTVFYNISDIAAAVA